MYGLPWGLAALVAVATWSVRSVGAEATAPPVTSFGACTCADPWPAVQKDFWSIFNRIVDVASLMDCLSVGTQNCISGDQLPTQMLSQRECSAEILPTISTRVCAAGMMHYMLLCALQMWLLKIFRQSALYFEHSFGYLALAYDCLEGSDWPLWPGQIIRNYRAFLTASFPPGPLAVERRFSDEGIEYFVAGPTVIPNSFRWWTGPRVGLYCPPDPEPWRGVVARNQNHGETVDAKVGESQAVHCAIPIVWPGEEEAARAIASTFGKDCDKLTFFLAAPDGETAEMARVILGRISPKANVVNLAEEWPDMIRDSDAALASHGRRQISGANQKDLLLFAHLASDWLESRSSRPDWVCRVETDSYFAPANFKRFVRGKALAASKPWFLGSISYWQMHFEPRLIFNEQVQCLSSVSVERLAVRVRSAPSAGNTSYTRCELAPGHRGDLMLAICLGEVGVIPHADIADDWGREYFLNYRMEDAALYSPSGSYGTTEEDPRRYQTNAAMHWRGKAHIFLPCLGHRDQIWASPYPISFHDYKNPEGIYYVHDVLTGQRDCDLCPAGYKPTLAKL